MGTITATGAESAYLTARAAFRPEPSDNPDCIPFYAAFHAARVVLNSHGITDADIRDIHSLLHQAIGWSGNGPTWDAVMTELTRQLGPLETQLRDLTSTPPYQLDPWDPEPASPDDPDAIESRAHSIFEVQFRQRFPGVRINSKVAKEKWAEVAPQARKLAYQALDDEHAAWQTRKDFHEKKRAGVIAEWQERCEVVRARIAIVQRVLEIPR